MSDSTLENLFRERFGRAPDVPDVLTENAGLMGLARRGSCRHFTTDPVDRAVLETLCATALCAPSKSDLQQRDMLILTDPALMRDLKALLSAQTWIGDAPALVVFLANNKRQRQIQHWQNQPFPNDHLDAFFNASVDAGIALAFFMAATETAGLGCCPISTIRNHMDEVRTLLRLPDHVFPVAGMAVGYPAQKPRVSARLALSDTVHFNQFSDVTKEDIAEYDERRLAGSDGPGWSEAKAKMYAVAQRTTFAAFIRRIGFSLD